MITGENSQPPREVSGLTNEQRRDIDVYLKEMVSGWCESQGEESFAARHLVGGVNRNWEGTPLQCVYDKQTTDATTAYDVAGRDVGWLLKRVVIDDQRKFTCEKEVRNTNHYMWDGKYPKKS